MEIGMVSIIYSASGQYFCSKRRILHAPNGECIQNNGNV